MITFFREIFKSPEQQREIKSELLDLENNMLDLELAEEEADKNNKVVASCMENIMKVEEKSNNTNNGIAGINQVNGMQCFSRKGIITTLNSDNGTIDNFIYFDEQVAGHVFSELTVGCTVEYLCYNLKNSDCINVVKVQKVLEYNWDGATNEKMSQAIAALKKENPMLYNTQVRNVLGLIQIREKDTIKVDTDYGILMIKLEDIELTFIPKTGDRVYIECNVQLDETYVDRQGEILEVRKAMPTRMETDEKCIVERVLDELVILTDNGFVLKEDLDKGLELHLGDFIVADFIECDFKNFTRRAIKVKHMDKSFGQLKHMKNCFANTDTNHVITIIGEERIIFSELWEPKILTLKLKNNRAKPIRLLSVRLHGIHTEPQVKLLEPEGGTAVIHQNVQTSLVFEVTAKFFAESRERYTLQFENFEIKRGITIIACKTEEAAKEAEKRFIAAQSTQFNWSGRTAMQRSRMYTNHVWSSNVEVVPGVHVSTKRRFVSLRIGEYEVPKVMREIYLTMQRQREMVAMLEDKYPAFKEPLAVSNYAEKLHHLLHLEEIEYNIAFRNFDRDRAHMQRDKEFLSLQIDNLAERRPSLVVGDVVRAHDPCPSSDSGKINKAYEGVVHKVLFDRVHLKFNPHFHNNYNGEDYRLEFYFSRYGMRKQHYAISNIIKHMGERFVFHKKMEKRTHPQLEVRLEGGEDAKLMLYDSHLPWFNPNLNSLQKLAVCNILRGEASNMPYVIFGPPGTGKTVTIVETILQLARHVPNARLLVGTPANSSADLLAKRLVDSGALAPGDFIRLVSQNQVEKDLIPPDLMPFCATVDIGSSGTCQDTMITTDSGLKLRCQQKFMGRHRITISTCITLGNFIQMGFPPNHFTHVLIDEAGQCTEPETMVPMMLLNPERHQVVLAGDPHQLHPIIVSRYACEKGMAMSFLERLLNQPPYCRDKQRFPESSGFNPLLLTKLLYNYRALPSIMAIYNKLFYDDELVSMVDPISSREAMELKRLQKVFHPLKGMPHNHGTFFCGILSENKQANDSPSWYNPVEAGQVYTLTVDLYRNNIAPESIGILTPYVRQVKAIRILFIETGVPMPKIGSVEEFQGQERDVMLISTVRSSEGLLGADAILSLGFVRSKKRMNVALSRARFLMVIFGNPHLLAVDQYWRQLLLFCAHNNAYYGCELPDSIAAENDLQETNNNNKNNISQVTQQLDQ